MWINQFWHLQHQDVPECNLGLKQNSYLLIPSLNAISDILVVQVCAHFQEVGLLVSFWSIAGVQGVGRWGKVWMLLPVCVHDSCSCGSTLLYCAGHYVCQCAIKGCCQLWLGGQRWVQSHISCSQTVKACGRMTNAIFFLAANTFPLCSQDVGWNHVATSEVREIIAMPAVKSCNNFWHSLTL
jgi:hypothetical protein